MDKINTGERLDSGAIGPIMLEHLHRYALVLEAVCNKQVLDVACGEGYGAALMAPLAAHVVGVDIDHDTILKAKKKYTQSNLTFVQASITALPFAAATFDVIICFETIEHVQVHDAVLTELKRVLKSGGVLVISTPNKDEYSEKRDYHNPFHLKELTTNEFKQLLKIHFNYYHCLLQECLLASFVCNENENILEESFTGDFTTIRKTASIRPMYVIALASQQPISLKIPSGIFRNDILSQQFLDEERSSAKATISYKLGHALLWPLKKIFSSFNPKT